ncbi:MAG: 2-hydroxyhepta-2,4-diene,7-dioate isomerase [Rhodospirillales bacterium]|nr:2-hydroxyhepta-2,4-diene,7-dioate isomerase [Rhodospirillales bacterium]
MKFLSFASGGRESWGAVKGDTVVDLGWRMAGCPQLIDALRQGRLDEAKDLADKSDVDLALDGIRYLPTIPQPEKIVCIGVNYANRNAEYKDGSDEAAYPSIFMRTPGSLVGNGEPILRPPESDQLDYEGEIAIVIGQGGRRIAKEDFAHHIAGFACCNEGTIRDWLRHSKFNVTQGKNFAHSGSLGPWMVSADEFKRYDDIAVKTRVNGETRQDDTTANIIFDFAFLISYVSSFMELKPGDIIATGTPIGAGARFDPPKWLKPGDVVEVEIGGVGTLRNTIADEIAS